MFVPPSPGTKTGSLLEPGGIALNSVLFETVRGEATPAEVLLSNRKVTVCGSAAPIVGLYHSTLSPTLIVTA